MSSKILAGPLLGYEEGGYYTVCLLTEPMAAPPTMKVTGKSKLLAFAKKATVGSNLFWRVEFKVTAGAKGKRLDYSIKSKNEPLQDLHGRDHWQFYVPGKNEQPRIGYASCNGFSSAKLARDTDEPYALWKRMAKLHAEQPFSLLLLGGDQVYADEIWESRRCPSLQDWNELSWKEQNAAKVTARMQLEIKGFYDWLYTDRWKDEQMSLMFACIPSVMMWDDHDIFDGWGSYPPERQASEVFQKVFQEAARVFDILQLRCSTRSRLNPGAAHRTLRLRFRDYHILALDNRSERTQKQIMSEAHWQDVKGWLGKLKPRAVKNLVVMTGVPAVYRSFTAVEKLFETTPWHEELEDDVQDHWSATSHQAERMRLIMVLLKFLKESAAPNAKGILLSGDVHVGAVGQIWDEARQVGLTQVISSGIVHPPPTALGWVGITLMTSDEPVPLGEGDAVAEMVTPAGGDRYLRVRNFAYLFIGTEDKIWVNWVCEVKKLKPSFAIA